MLDYDAAEDLACTEPVQVKACLSISGNSNAEPGVILRRMLPRLNRRRLAFGLRRLVLPASFDRKESSSPNSTPTLFYTLATEQTAPAPKPSPDTADAGGICNDFVEPLLFLNLSLLKICCASLARTPDYSQLCRCERNVTT
jgi:hypothetical protein